MDIQSKVLHGTCGWSDESLLRCGRFYPHSVRSIEERLDVYSTHFPCVEVDSSCYAIPSATTTAKWVRRTPPGFLFHFKAFGLFTSRSAPLNTLPGFVRPLVTAATHLNRVHWDQMEPRAQELVWRHFHNALEPVYQGLRMGLVLFQFHLNFQPTAANREHVLGCRRRLNRKFQMAVEFRNRSWITDEEGDVTERWLREHGLVLVVADELLHETMQPDRAQTGLPPGQTRSVMPMRLAVTAAQDGCSYIRVHRRHGTMDRRLTDEEIKEWAERVRTFLPKIAGPCYFLWGTDWEDSPIVNAHNLDAAIGKRHAYDWSAIVKADAACRKTNLHAFFSKPATKMGTGPVETTVLEKCERTSETPLDVNSSALGSAGTMTGRVSAVALGPLPSPNRTSKGLMKSLAPNNSTTDTGFPQDGIRKNVVTGNMPGHQRKPVQRLGQGSSNRGSLGTRQKNH